MTEVKVLIPAVMSSSTNGEREVEIEGSTVIEVIDELAKKYGDGFKNKVIDIRYKILINMAYELKKQGYGV